MRVLALAIVCAVALASCAGSGEKSSRSSDTSSSGAPTFGVVGSDDTVWIVDAEPHRVADVEAVDLKLVPLDAVTLVGTDAQHIVLLTRDGVDRSAACDGCRGAAVKGDKIYTAVTSTMHSDSLELVTFDRDLQEVDRRTVRKAVSREAGGIGDVPSEEEASPPSVVGISKNGDVVVSYLAVGGGARGGPSIVAGYRATGELTGFAEIGGVARSGLLDDDATMAAVLTMGSGGACTTTVSATVVDLDTFVALDTNATPGEADERDVMEERNAQVGAAWWDGDVLHTVARADTGWDDEEDILATSECDPAPTLWTQQTNPRGDGDAMEQVTEGGVTIGVVGDTCDTRIGLTLGSEGGYARLEVPGVSEDVDRAFYLPDETVCPRG